MFMSYLCQTLTPDEIDDYLLPITSSLNRKQVHSIKKMLAWTKRGQAVYRPYKCISRTSGLNETGSCPFSRYSEVTVLGKSQFYSFTQKV
jgi:hypothetical protein